MSPSARQGTDPPPILLLHGGWGGTWCWSRVIPPLTAAGHVAVAVDLVGGGLEAVEPPAFRSQDRPALAAQRSPWADLTIDGYAGPVLDTLRDVRRAHGPVVVVGHSITGVLLHVLGEQAPEAIQGLIYLAATAPGPGRTVAMDTLEKPWAESLFSSLLVADPTEIGALRINPASADPAYRQALRRCFFNDVPDPITEVAARLLTCDNPGLLSTQEASLTAGRWGSLQRAWIRTADDRAIPAAGQDTNIAELDAAFPQHPFEVSTIDTGHMALLGRPAEVAEAIHRWAA